MTGNNPEAIHIYHLTHFNNLSNIIMEGGLKCYNLLNEVKANYENIAHNSLQARRASVTITCGPGGNLLGFINKTSNSA